MATKYSVDVSTTGTVTQPFISGSRRGSLKSYAKFLKSLLAGTANATLTIRNTKAAASGTITLATCLTGTEIEVNGAKFRAITSGTPTIANGEFVISGDDTADAVSLVAAINGSTNARISGIVTASSALGVVTVTAVSPGATANGVTIKTNGVVAKGTCTVVVAATDLSDTVSINGTAMTAIVQRATGTVAFSTAVAGNTVTINHVVFTGTAGAVTLGANTFSIDTGNTETATSLAAQVNACTDPNVAGKITATSVTDTVTLRAVAAGTGGNSYTLTKSGSPITVSDTTLLGGIAVANNQFDFSPGSTATQVAEDIVRCCNASTSALINQHVTATNEAGVVTFWALYSGTPGNAIGLLSSDADGLAVTGSGYLAGGTEANYNGAQATGTLTLTGVANGETVTVNGVVITAHTNTQANNQFTIAGDDTADAAALCLAINNSTTAALADVIATSATNVVTVKARRGGPSGNAIATVSQQASIVASVARLTTGAVPTTVVPSGARLASGAETKFALSY